MKLTIEATENLTDIDGVTVRLWNGKTEDGTPCLVFVHRIAVDPRQDSSKFDQALKETLPPGRFVPLSRFL